MDIENNIKKWFPKINGKNFKISKLEGNYNCISYTLDIYDYWLWSNEEDWPNDIPRNLKIEGFKLLYKKYNYEECNNYEYEEGYDKIAFYAKNGYPEHACKQYNNIWKSRVAPNIIIEHELDWLTGNSEFAYGDIVFIMKRKK